MLVVCKEVNGRILIFSVSIFRVMRSQHGIDESSKMIKKLHDNSVKLEEFYSNMFTGGEVKMFPFSSFLFQLIC